MTSTATVTATAVNPPPAEQEGEAPQPLLPPPIYREFKGNLPQLPPSYYTTQTPEYQGTPRRRYPSKYYYRSRPRYYERRVRVSRCTGLKLTREEAEYWQQLELQQVTLFAERCGSYDTANRVLQLIGQDPDFRRLMQLSMSTLAQIAWDIRPGIHLRCDKKEDLAGKIWNLYRLGDPCARLVVDEVWSTLSIPGAGYPGTYMVVPFVELPPSAASQQQQPVLTQPPQQQQSGQQPPSPASQAQTQPPQSQQFYCLFF